MPWTGRFLIRYFSDRNRQGCLIKIVTPHENNPTLYGVFKFTDVSWPGIAEKKVHALGSNAGYITFVFCCIFFDKKVCKKRDVGCSLAQGRDMERNYIQPVVEIFPEVACLDFIFKDPVGCSNNPDID